MCLIEFSFLSCSLWLLALRFNILWQSLNVKCTSSFHSLFLAIFDFRVLWWSLSAKPCNFRQHIECIMYPLSSHTPFATFLVVIVVKAFFQLSLLLAIFGVAFLLQSLVVVVVEAFFQLSLILVLFSQLSLLLDLGLGSLLQSMLLQSMVATIVETFFQLSLLLVILNFGLLLQSMVITITSCCNHQFLQLLKHSSNLNIYSFNWDSKTSYNNTSTLTNKVSLQAKPFEFLYFSFLWVPCPCIFSNSSKFLCHALSFFFFCTLLVKL